MFVINDDMHDQILNGKKLNYLDFIYANEEYFKKK